MLQLLLLFNYCCNFDAFAHSNILIIMNILKRKLPSTRQQKDELNRYGLLNHKLQPQLLHFYCEYCQITFNKLHAAHLANPQNYPVIDKIKEIINILTQNNKEITLSYIVKKMAFLHYFFNSCCQHSLLEEINIQFFSEQVMVILKQDIENLLHPESKRESSLTKLKGYLRDISRSKEKQLESKLQIQVQREKGAMKEILQRILQPFCLYLLKIIQDSELFAIVKKTKKSEQSINWKIINWSIGLGDILIQLNRLGRYFKQDLMGVWVFVSYMISVDMSVFYQHMRNNIDSDCQQWCDKIKIIQKLNKINKRCSNTESQAILGNVKFMQLKSKIDETIRIKEKMNYIYCNKRLEQWKNIFVLPSLNQNNNHYETILSFIQDHHRSNKHIGKDGKDRVRSNTERESSFSRKISQKDTQIQSTNQTKVSEPTERQQQHKNKYISSSNINERETSNSLHEVLTKKQLNFGDRRKRIMGNAGQ